MTVESGTALSRSLELAVEGGSLYVEVAGEGPAILMLHGWSLDHRSFEPQVRSLADRCKVIVFDRRGFGRSSAPPDLTRELDDIDRILDALGIDSVHLVGVSQGGRIALRYASTRSHRVRSLTPQGAMVDGVPIADTGSDEIPLREYAALAMDGKLDELHRRWLAHPMLQTHAGGDLLATIVSDYEARDLLHQDSSALQYDADPLAALTSFEKPVLLVTGKEETQARKEHARRILRCAPMAREIIMPRSGHLANLEESDAFNAVLADFVDRAER